MLTITYLHYQHIETDLVNPFQSGLGWVEQSISTNKTIEKSVEVSNPVNNISPKLIIGLQGGTTDRKVRPAPSNKIAIRHNSQQSSILSNIYWTGLGQKTSTLTLTDESLISGLNSFYFTNNSTDGYSQPYFDYFTLSYGRQLNFTGEQFEFYTPIHSNPINFTMSSVGNPIIWS